MHEIASTLVRLVQPSSTEKNKSFRESREFGTDRRRLTTAIGELTDTFAETWCSVDLNELPFRLGSTNIFCLSAFPMPSVLAKSVDAQLQKFKPYLGAVELDVGNPLHGRLFQELLDCVYFSGSTVFVSAYPTDDGFYDFAETLDHYFKVVKLSSSDYDEQAPSFPDSVTRSLRALLTQTRLQKILTRSHFEVVASELVRNHGKPNQPTLDFELIAPDARQMEIPIGKLLQYALNTSHEKGKHKARLFSELLEIESRHWRYLAYQLTNGLLNASVDDVRVTKHGIQYGARIPVLGLNGKSYAVQTGWIIRPAEPAQLTTAYPAEKSYQDGKLGLPPPWIGEVIRGADRWKALHSLASEVAKVAADDCVPVPMQIEGFPIILEGQFGGGWIRLDGRGAFAKWLVQNDHGSSDFGKGVHVSARSSTHSVERAKEYAIAYQRVLWLNGIESVVETYLS